MKTSASRTVSWQSSLLEAAPPAAAAASGRDISPGDRRVLDRVAWIDYLPAWLPEADRLFDHLLHTVPWQADSRRMYDRVVAVPRLTAWYQFPDSPHPDIRSAAAALSERYRGEGYEPFASAGLCLYRTGDDSVAWHGDRIGRGAQSDTVVAILSLGNPRALSLRPRGGGSSRRFLLGHGDLLVMGGSCQRTWDHAVLKTRHSVGPRVSVQLRPAGVA